MRIMHITATHLGFAGGVPLMLKELITEQNKIENFESRLLSINADVKDIDCTYFDYLGNRKIEDYIRLYKPDIAIIHSFFHVEYAKVYKILRKLEIPYFIEPHGSFNEKAFHKSRIKKFIANRTIFYGLINNAYGYIYLCEGERDNSIYHKTNDIIIPNGIRHKEAEVTFNDVLKLYYIGRFDIHEKGIDILFDALELLDMDEIDFEFDFYGTGTEKEIKYIEERSSKLQHIKVHNNGPIYGDEKDQVIKKYDIMVLLSRHEGFPMSILEAWNYGIPCIVSPETNVGTIVTKNKIGWVSNLHQFDIYKTFKEAILSYENGKENYCKNCNEYVLKNHQWDHLARLSYSLFQSKVKKVK